MRIAIIIAGLFGATGVGLSALAAHRDATGTLAIAASMLLFHAPAFLALAALPATRFKDLSVVALAIGVALFSADIAVRSLFEWPRLFAMAAPAGGLMMIDGWLLVALSGMASVRE